MSEIHFEQAVVISKQVDAKQLKKQEETLKEFLESKCDIFNSDDWDYYVQATGKSLDWLRENATYSDELGEYGTMLDNAIIDGDFELAAKFYI